MQKTSRRNFLRTMILGGIVLQIPFVFSCNSSDLKALQIKINNNLFSINTELLQQLLNILFPKSTIAPSALELKADIYYLWYLQDNRLKPKKREYLVYGLDKIQKYAIDNLDSNFIDLPLQKQEEIIKFISTTKWGKNYLSSLMTIIFEAMFANPVYESNPDKIGWQWLNFKGGYPEPSIRNRYPEILNLHKTLSHEQ